MSSTNLQNNSVIISQIYKSRLVLLDQMSRLGYSVDDYSGFGVADINTMKTNNQLDMILEKSLDNDETLKTKVYVKYYLAKPLKASPNLQEIVDDLFHVEQVLSKSDVLYIVVRGEPNETLLNALKHIWESEGIFIIVQPLQRLQYNLLEHVLVPPHRALTEDEKIKIKTKYNITSDDEFPDMPRFDPVAQAICLRPGQLCEIIRPSKTAVEEYFYKICM